MWNAIASVLAGLLLIAMRIVIAVRFPPESASMVGSYQAVAHLFVGGLAVAYYFQRKRWQAVLFWLLIAVEISAAVLSRVL